MSLGAKCCGEFLLSETNTVNFILKMWHPRTAPASPLKMSTVKCNSTCSLPCRPPGNLPQHQHLGQDRRNTAPLISATETKGKINISP